MKILALVLATTVVALYVLQVSFSTLGMRTGGDPARAWFAFSQSIMVLWLFLMLPLFVCEGEGVRREVPSMPGVFNLSVDETVKEVAAARGDGIRSVLLFGLPDHKDSSGSAAFDADGVRGKFGVSPAQIPDYLGLVGDVVDNLPGVPGIGAKSAAAILQVFESIESIPASAESGAWSRVQVRGASKLAEKVSLHRDRALATKSLATVLREVPGFSPRLADLAYRGADRGQTEKLFDRLGWSRIRDRVPRWRE